MIDRVQMARAIHATIHEGAPGDGMECCFGDAARIVDAYEELDVDESLEERPIRGETGTITGPPIVGTNDTDNAGPPVLADDEDYVSDVYIGDQKYPGGIRKLEGEVIGDSEGVVDRPYGGGWKPAGEVGVITGAGTSVVEEPKNDARRVIKQVGPGPDPE